jgi:hypothetical protein
MNLRRMLAVIVLVGLSVAGCYHRAKPDFAQLRYRASLDLRCREELGVHPAGARTQVVRGCGQEAVYIHDCNVASDQYASWETDCTWRLDRQPAPITAAR